jgi:hypothetical protein
MILDVESDQPTEAKRRALCERISLPFDRYPAVLDGLADTEAAYAYAPEVVRAVRRMRQEQFTFERRNRRWSKIGI